MNFWQNLSLQRIRWLTLPVVFGLLGAVLLRRRNRPEVALDGAPLPVPAVPAPISSVVLPPVPQSKPSRKQSPLRWSLFLFMSLVCAGLLLALQDQFPQFSTAIFLIILLIALGYAILRTVQQLARQMLTIRSLLRSLWRLLQLYKEVISFVGVGIAFLCAVSSTLLFKDTLSYAPLLTQAVLMFVPAWLMFGLVLALKPTLVLPERWRGRREMAADKVAPFRLGNALVRLMAAMSGVCLLFLVAEMNANALRSSLLSNAHHVIQFMFLVLGVVLLVLGMGIRPRLPAMTKRELLVFSGVVLLALALRVLALDSVVHRYVDEMNFMNAIPILWAKPETRILVPFFDGTEFTWIYPLLQSGISNIIGSGLPGIRLISAVFGVLGVVAFYFLVRTLFHNKWLALMSALILATFPAHIHFSRIGVYNIADPFFGTLALAFLMRGFQSHNRSDYVIAGAALGLTQYFYEGGRLLYPPLLVVVFIVCWLLNGRRKADFIHAVYGLLAAILVAAPIYYAVISMRGELTPRLNAEALVTNSFAQSAGTNQTLVSLLLQRFFNSLLMYIAIPDQSWFYGGQQALILLPLAPYFYWE